MTSPYDDFLLAANPHAWLLSADDLHREAVSLYGRRGREQITLTSKAGAVSRDVVDRPAFLLAGFALENAIKAFLVYENPAWVSNGMLARTLRSHSLRELQSKSRLVPYKMRHLNVLRAFEDGLESWSRYPCGLTAADTRTAASLPIDLWAKYLLLMRAYGTRMVDLLGVGWNGPHGFHASWTFGGGFLEMCERRNRK
ncbi:hypothetical protein [Caulobacter sp. Root343]|uniref:hypothetical protein n=1 Tax=Caulobacter sp. Root343 TaxID=1736520 RepID=UPI0006F7A024|nr:hypothetical protein [Caulobacter sp. Root343]KQV64081.1 hypothetical protein ASC70_19865 [Caulobacter sp. Root343]